MNTNDLLEVIVEKTSNIEHLSQAEKVKQSLSDTLKLLAKREKILRESTIMVKLSNSLTPAIITETVESQYCNVINKPSASYWQDKEFMYVQFTNNIEKDCFVDWVQLNDMTTEFNNAIQAKNDEGEHLQRKPIRIMINNVRKVIRAELVELTLKRIIEDENGLQNFREGKANALTGGRSIMFNINADSFRKLFGSLDGTIPYVNTATNTKTRLFLKLNCKPWACRDCFAFGMHQCEGKLCGNCGHNGHITKDCKSKTKFCKNCKRKGHRAKDTHCPIYLAEVAKELRKICIPIEYFEDKVLRFNLLNHTQIS